MTWPHDDELHAWWVEPCRLLAGEYPASSSAAGTTDKVQLLVDAGIDSIVDLTTPDDGLASYQEALAAAAAKAKRQVRHTGFPIPDNGVIDQDGYDSIVEHIREEMRAGRVVYVHCWGGRGRTSTVVGCLLIDDGLDYDAAIAHIADLRAGTRKARFPCPESESQHLLLRDRANLRW